MPSLIRFLVALVIVAVLVAGALFYLVYMVQPGTRNMTIRIPASELQPKPQVQTTSQAQAAPQGQP